MQAFFSLDDELGEAADVFEGGALGEFDDPIGDRIDEVAVVGNEEKGSGPGGELLLEPGDRVDIEVVGRLVEDQHVGFGEEQAGQRHAHAPTTRELADGTVAVGVLKSETGENLAGVGLEGVAAHRLVLALDLAVLGEQRVVGVGVRRSVRVGDRSFEPMEFLGQVGHLAGAGQHLFEHRTSGGVDEILRQVAEGHVLGFGDRAPIGFGIADEDLDQRRLARAVAADERDASPRRQLQGDIGEQVAGSVGAGEARRGEHDRLRLRTRMPSSASSAPTGHR